METKNKIIFAILAITAVTLSATTAGILGVTTGSSQAQVSNSGNIVNIGVNVYSDQNGQTPCTSLDWGSLNPGGQVTKTVYIKNTGNHEVTLTMTPSNWSPALASTVLSLNWDRQNYVLPVGQTIAATLTLTAAADTGTLTDFSFTITIVGSW